MAFSRQRLITNTRLSCLRLPLQNFTLWAGVSAVSNSNNPVIQQQTIKQRSIPDVPDPLADRMPVHLEGRCRFCKGVLHRRDFSHATTLARSPHDQAAPTKRAIHSCAILEAGHNKWSKVKHIKGPKDLERSKMFTKIGIQLKMAVREGGHNPETNPTLANIVAFAKAKMVPKGTLEAMIKRVATSKQGDTQATFEVRGPGNSSLLVSVLTDNTKRAKMELAHIASKNGGTLGEPGTAMFAFQRKGVMRVPCEIEGQGSMTFDDAEEMAIDIGAEEVTESTEDDGQNIFMFVCDPSDLRGVRDGLVSRSLQFQSCSLEFIPQTTVTLSESDLEKAAHLINVLEGHEDVVKVFDNVASGE